MVIENVYLDPFLSLLLKNPRQFGPCFIVAEDIELESDDKACLFNAAEDGIKGFPSLVKDLNAVTLDKTALVYLFD